MNLGRGKKYKVVHYSSSKTSLKKTRLNAYSPGTSPNRKGKEFKYVPSPVSHWSNIISRYMNSYTIPSSYTLFEPWDVSKHRASSGPRCGGKGQRYTELRANLRRWINQVWNFKVTLATDLLLRKEGYSLCPFFFVGKVTFLPVIWV